MPITQEQIPTGRVSPTGWIRLSTGSYADPNMLLGADGQPLTNINFYQAHLAAQKLGFRLTDDIEHNDLVNGNPEAAEQMRNYAAWTSLLRDVEKSGKEYTAKRIARPEVSRVEGSYVAKGSEKATKLPKHGYFRISHLLQSDDGLPHETFDNPPDEPFAYWAIAEGKERPVSRGGWDLGERGGFDAGADWESLNSDPGVGARVASDNEPSPIMIATAEAVGAIEEIGRRHNLKPEEVVAGLRL